VEFYADIVLISSPPLSERIAVVEINNRADLKESHGSDREARMRLGGGAARYFMLVSQDVAFLWDTAEPNYVRRIEMSAIFRRFIPDLDHRERLYGFQVEMIVSAWLSELAAGWRDATDEPERQLADVGFLEAVRGARVHTAALA
jgi:hypothetical protein